MPPLLLKRPYIITEDEDKGESYRGITAYSWLISVEARGHTVNLTEIILQLHWWMILKRCLTVPRQMVVLERENVYFTSLNELLIVQLTWRIDCRPGESELCPGEQHFTFKQIF